jgi:hypothetical protein
MAPRERLVRQQPRQVGAHRTAVHLQVRTNSAGEGPGGCRTGQTNHHRHAGDVSCQPVGESLLVLLGFWVRAEDDHRNSAAGIE